MYIYILLYICVCIILHIIPSKTQPQPQTKPRFRLLGHQNTSLRMAQLRVTAPVAAASAMFNNRPLVAMLVPLVQAWALRHGHHAAQLLMPGMAGGGWMCCFFFMRKRMEMGRLTLKNMCLNFHAFDGQQWGCHQHNVSTVGAPW